MSQIECKGSIALETECGGCLRCFEEASQIVFRYKNIMSTELSERMFNKVCRANHILLVGLGSIKRVQEYLRRHDDTARIKTEVAQ